MATAAEIRSHIEAMIERARKQSRPHIEINAGEIERWIGKPNETRTANYCSVMEQLKNELGGDYVHRTDSGMSPSLTIRYPLA